LKAEKPFGRPRCVCEDNIKLHDNEYDEMGWIGLFWCGTGAVGGGGGL
jgi:hypothetical protein